MYKNVSRVFAIFAFAASAQVSFAQTILTSDLTSDHCTGGCGPQTSPFGQVLVTQPGTDVLDFAVSLNNGNKFVKTGFDATFAFNLTGYPTVTYSNLTSGWDVPTGQGISGNFHQDGTGYFDYGVLWGTQGGGHGTADPLTFQISGTGLTPSSLTQNAAGQYFAVDIWSGTNGNTGNIDGSQVILAAVPEPEKYALMLAGLGLVGFIARRRMRLH